MKLKTFSIDEPNYWVGGISIVRAANKQEAFDAFSTTLAGHPGLKGRTLDINDVEEVPDERGRVVVLNDGNY